MNPPDFLNKIDWELLREQKKIIVKASFNNPTLDIDNINTLYGLVYLIDALQDYAADEMGLGEEKVFGILEE